MSNTYLDTSALAKWYIHENLSDEVESFILSQDNIFISHLCAVEFRCLLARRRRNKEITAHLEQLIYKAFENDLLSGQLKILSIQDHHLILAIQFINSLRTVSLRSLDAIHLAIAKEYDCSLIATADQTLAKASEKLSLTAKLFL